MRIFSILTSLILTLAMSGQGNASAQDTVVAPSEVAINFSKITSPIIFRGDGKFAYRDPAAVYHEGVFYLYFTLSVRDSDDGYFNMTAYSISRDLCYWSYPRIITPKDRTLNFSSPGNIVRHDDTWVLCLQTYPTPQKEDFGTEDSRLFTMRSDDLLHWSSPTLLKVKGDDVPVEEMGRMIDPYLLPDADKLGRWWCFYKQNGVSMSFSDDLEHWTYAGHAQAGENVTVLRVHDAYVMFHSPRNGIGVKRSKNPRKWGDDTQLLTLGQEKWPWAQGRLTAATVLDLKDDPRVGKYIMFFHGSSKEGLATEPAHGAASMAIAWSDDLEHWYWPKEK